MRQDMYIIEHTEDKMTDSPPNIIGPVGGLMGIGIMALAAKGVIDIVKETADKQKREKRPLYKEPTGYTPRAESDVVNRGLNRMLGR